MNRLLVCALLMGCASAAAATTSAADKAPPNIVYFLVDDMGREDCGFMGGVEIKTPHIDRLAAAGATLDAFYVQPLCSPTRAALLTGRYPMRFGLQVGVVKPWAKFGLPLDERTLADDLKAAGYETGIFGKWHLGHFAPEYLPLKRGFVHQYGHYNGALDYFTHVRDGGFDWHKDDQICRDEGYSTDLIGEHAAKFVTDNAGKKPFFLYVPFNAVHSPYEPPKGGVKAYPNLKGQRQKYAAMLTSVDHAINGVVEAIEKAGVRDNTLFIFSSDNGGPSPGRITDNGKYRGGKGGVYEGGVRVAACATWDGHIAAGSKVTEPIHVVDWRPTLLELCHAKPTAKLAMDGRDAWQTIAAGAKSPHDVILLNTAPAVGAVRAGDWKLVVHHEGGGQRGGKPNAKANEQEEAELYNLRDDPYEKSNVANEHPEEVKELQGKLAALAEQAVPPKAKPQPKDYKAPKVWGEFGG